MPLATLFRHPRSYACVLLLGGLAFAACLESPTPGATAGTGGNAVGGSPTGGSAGQGERDCTAAGGSGGAFWSPTCPEWLEGDGAEGRFFEPLPISCDEGEAIGEGGHTGDPPALRRLCEAESKPDLLSVHPIYFCLNRVKDDPCAADVDEVKSCLTQISPCDRDANSDLCDDLREGCPALDYDTCWGAMTIAGDTDYVTTCFGEPRQGEACRDRFFRCAWGL